jgi:hypothetical protein
MIISTLAVTVISNSGSGKWDSNIFVLRKTRQSTNFIFAKYAHTLANSLIPES